MYAVWSLSQVLRALFFMSFLMIWALCVEHESNALQVQNTKLKQAIQSQRGVCIDAMELPRGVYYILGTVPKEGEKTILILESNGQIRVVLWHLPMPDSPFHWSPKDNSVFFRNKKNLPTFAGGL